MARFEGSFVEGQLVGSAGTAAAAVEGLVEFGEASGRVV